LYVKVSHGFGSEGESYKDEFNIETSYKGKKLKAQTIIYDFSDTKMFEALIALEENIKKIAKKIKKLREKNKKIKKAAKNLIDVDHPDELILIQLIEELKSKIEKLRASKAKIKKEIIEEFAQIGENIYRLVRGAQSINLGTKPDVMVGMVPIIQCYEKEKPAVIFAHSRGGSEVIHKLHALCKPEKHLRFWKKMGILKNSKVDFKKIDGMKKNIKKVYLCNPLLDLNPIFKKIGDLIAKKIIGKIPKETESKQSWAKHLSRKYHGQIRPALKFLTASSAELASKIGLEISTAYKHFFRKQPIDLMEEVAMSGIPIYISLANPDKLLGNDNDEKLLELSRKYPNVEVKKINESHRDCRATKIQYQRDIVKMLEETQKQKEIKF